MAGSSAIISRGPSTVPGPEPLAHQVTAARLGPIETLGDLIRVSAQDVPGSACVVSVAGDRLTWQQLNSQLEQTRAMLRRSGLGAESRIALVLPNGPTLAVAFLTVAACAGCAPLNPVYSADEFAFYLTDLKAAALIVSGDAAAAVEAAKRLSIPVLQLEPDLGVPGLFRLGGDLTVDGEYAGDVTSDTIALLLHTSGTTARPKLVPLRQRNLIASARNMVDTLRLSDADRCLNLMPLFHIHGLVGGLVAPLMARGSAVCPPNFRPSDFFTWVEATKPTWYTAVPTMHRAIAAEAVGKDDVITRHPFRFIRSSSASLPSRLFADLGRIFSAPIVEAYSMTEAAHQMTCNPLPPGKQKAGTVGRPAGPEVALMDEAGNLLPTDKAGEIVLRGPAIMSGYEANPSANAEAFVNGWFRTGDLGRFDSDGYLVVTGRLKEQINRGGEKISPLEIDEALLKHPDVSEAVAFGVPHDTLGEDIAAAVVLRAGANVGPNELRAFLREHVAPFKIPRRLLILDQIPKGPTGKIQRRKLAEALRVDASRSLDERVEAQDDLEGLELELSALWRKILNRPYVGLDDDFFESGGDSLMALQMLLELEAIVGRDIPETILFDRPTIRQLAQAIPEIDSSRTMTLVPVQPKGDRPPLFFFHGDYIGYGYYTRRLARLLGSEQPFYSVAPHGLDSASIPRSIEQMAAERLPLILKVQPHGPFRLGGYCNGGMVAFEVARLLSCAGHRVDLVILIDTPTLNVRPSVRIVHRNLDKIMRLVSDDWEISHPQLASAFDLAWRQFSNFEQSSFVVYSSNMLSAFQRRLSRKYKRADPPTNASVSSSAAQLRAELDGRDKHLARTYNRLFRRYFPEKTNSPVVYFSAEYTGGRLQGLGPNVELVPLPGGHWGCITTRVDVLAGHLRRRLEALTGSAQPEQQWPLCSDLVRDVDALKVIRERGSSA